MSSLPPDPASLTATAIARLVASRDISAVELATWQLERIASVNPTLHALLTVSATEALEAARAADALARSGAAPPPLLGVPITVKDLEDTAGIRTTYGSTCFAHHVPERDSLAVARLRSAGAVILGKSNTPEFGLLGETRNRLGPECRNPWDPRCTPGGSSGGAAAAVAAGLGSVALGSDGAGSIVAPAAMCGVLGLKPTHGRVPAYPSLTGSGLYADRGPLARTVADLALLLDVLAGDDTTALPSFSVEAARFSEPVRGLRIAASADLGRFAVEPDIAAAVAAAAATLEGMGAHVDWAAPDLPDPWPIYDPVFLADTWSELGELAEQHPEEFVPDALAEVLAGRLVTQVDVVRALARWWQFRRRMETFFDTYDALLTPATATAAFPLGAPPAVIGGQVVRPHWTTFMPFPVAFNMTGNPEISVPCGLTGDGRPIGVLVVSGFGRDDRALSVAHALVGDGAVAAPASVVGNAADDALWT